MYDKYGKLDLDDFSMEDFTEMMFGEGGMMEKVNLYEMRSDVKTSGATDDGRHARGQGNGQHV